MKLFIDPHGDDGVLFGSFTIRRKRPLVLVVFDSYIQTARGAAGCDWLTRRQEARRAMCELAQGPPFNDIRFLGLEDNRSVSPRGLKDLLWLHAAAVDEVWAPAFEEGGHEHHNLVAKACDAFEENCTVHRYLTYTRGGGKSRGVRDYGEALTRAAVEVLPASAEDIAAKLRAMVCFKSQMQLDPRIGCAEWFYGNDLREYALNPSKEAATK